MNYILKIVAAFFATYFFSIMFNTHKKELVYCGLIGSTGWSIYMISFDIFKYTTEMSTFLASLVIGVIACQFARLRKAPVTTFLVAGIIPLVPGAGMYRTMHALLSNNYNGTVYQLIETLQTAGAIAIALAFPLTLMIKKPRKT